MSLRSCRLIVPNYLLLFGSAPVGKGAIFYIPKSNYLRFVTGLFTRKIRHMIQVMNAFSGHYPVPVRVFSLSKDMDSARVNQRSLVTTVSGYALN